ncbi:MAG: hypothetical protein A2750_00350 [Candidatus Yanofskybacteria bacterium RIFCSPHIGHO2_01_FULL_45_42]|uniref:SCP2 domain-containing protein n=3 Tax=Candidatus Yanofskyibacteriota TaxID=1752733 RepID=A0A1F8H4M8_9BACT|nr:MAG: hypothetical protein A2750_00350 [Candidatus Yanofskybacteria bacterium RIFCSPHIGHO2_01_FULL_45_42]OGN16712.1 MAG: hypothetical protein A3C81_02555 [Candidatus Yanofskybacteria bacterium RIFCSPHIGHO2_02_FULL_46_19]OGN27331.1 MAG: hypothetical protein A3B17_01800 [Candidatus Yanofskybacteria bacterium RIFCSPLOWO2_01_FULL_45_72]OGN32544.1 MAG: hypothetical protein A3J01_02595 [Candidatus Yanofskybacteria bacterium RIFCSPLOWO2_02_FULL_45_18]
MILVIKIQRQSVTLRLKDGPKSVGETTLTINRGFDTVLITALDKLLRRNKLKKLFLNRVHILGKMKPEAVLGRVLTVFAEALNL